ncbi:MAG: hypothetical protein QOK05_322 [Chloroflexota bacterium]|nr:hypothetical protein [Chloroflexota bacterium]
MEDIEDHPDDPFAFDDGPDEYPRYRGRRMLVKGVALVLIVGMLLAFPLGYLLDAELRNQHLEAVLALVELTIFAVLVAVVRSSRRPL